MRDASATLRAALDAGVHHFDTAGFYTRGRSEARLGRLLQALDYTHPNTGRPLSISTKIGKAMGRGRALLRSYGPEAIAAQLAACRDRLGREFIDVVYLHGPGVREINPSLAPLLNEREAGRIGAIGVCAELEPLRYAAKHPKIDVIMGRYNLFQRENEDIFRVAKEHKKKVIAIAPLAQALWRRDLLFPVTPSRAWYLARALVRSRDIFRKAQSAKWLHAIPGWSPVDVAFGFVRLNPHIDQIVTTTVRPHHIKRTAESLSRPIPEDIRARLMA